MGIVIHGDQEIVHGYVDESGTGGDGPIICSAGYLFKPDGAEEFRETWSAFLASHGLELFHATDCFRRRDADEIFLALVGLIKRTALRGFIRFMDRTVAKSIDPNLRRGTGSNYSLCTLTCMEEMAGYAKAHNQRIIYAIEDGNPFEGELRHFLDLIKSDPEQKENFAMARADTYSKKAVIQLQAADLLAWEFRRSGYRQEFTRNIRALINGKDEPGNPGHRVSGFSEISASIYAMVNGVRGFRSNRKRF